MTANAMCRPACFPVVSAHAGLWVPSAGGAPGAEGVALNRIFDPIRQFNHITFLTGIAFAAGQDIVLDDFFNSADHTLHGHEVDD